jgi:hypothetical protein
VLRARKIADLEVSAASGLVIVGDELVVVADDELALAVHDLAGRPRRRVPLLPGALPEEHDARKAAKPDLEALVALPGGALLALGSGSRPTRTRGALVRGDRVVLVELAPLYARLAAELPELNVEGAAADREVLRLLSRGNGPSRHDAVIDLDLAGVLADLERGAPLGQGLVRAIELVELPDLDGVPLTFTDAAPHPRGTLFSAAAEATASTYDDGPCAGSAVGLLTPSGALAAVVPLADARCKIEGIAVHGDRLLLVADPDDRARPAPLYESPLPELP